MITAVGAKKVAATMMRQFAKDGRFVLALPAKADLELMAEEFVTSFGCRIVWNHGTNRILVICPEITHAVVHLPVDEKAVV